MWLCTCKWLGRKSQGYLGYHSYFGNYCCLRSHQHIGESCMITQPDMPGTAPTQKSFTLNNFVTTATACKGQIQENVQKLLCNACVFLTCFSQLNIQQQTEFKYSKNSSVTYFSTVVHSLLYLVDLCNLWTCEPLICPWTCYLCQFL